MELNKYSIFDKMIEGVQIISNTWQYIYVNETVSVHGKFTQEELLGHTMMEKYPGIETTTMFHSLQRCMQEGITDQMINEFDFPDGSKGYFELRMQPVPEGVLILSFDVTKQKQAELLLKNSNELLDEKVKQRTMELSAKNKELEQFVHIASHDLQEPLRTVSNYIQLIKEEYAEKPGNDIKNYLNSTEKAIKRMSRMMKALLSYSYIGTSTKLVFTDCAQIVSELIIDLKKPIQTAEATIKTGKLPQLNAYEPELKELFRHLITNALKFRKKNVAPEITICSEQTKSGWKFTVSDNGIGIDPTHHERIFDIFQRLHLNEVYDGPGIGLANCKKIVALHKGEISVESQLGKGSKFIFTISKL